MGREEGVGAAETFSRGANIVIDQAGLSTGCVCVYVLAVFLACFVFSVTPPTLVGHSLSSVTRTPVVLVVHSARGVQPHPSCLVVSSVQSRRAVFFVLCLGNKDDPDSYPADTHPVGCVCVMSIIWL